MAKHRPGLVLLVVLASAGCALGIGVYDTFELLRLGRQVVMQALESWEVMLPNLPSDKVPGEDLVFMKMMERELLRQMDKISKQIGEYQEQTEIKTDMILTQLLLQLPMQRRLDDSLRELDHYIGQVNGLYKLFEMYAGDPDRYEKYTIIQFAKTCVSPRLGELPDVLKSIHRLVVPSEQQVFNRSVLVLLADQMKVGTWRMCVCEREKTVSEYVIEKVDEFPPTLDSFENKYSFY